MSTFQEDADALRQAATHREARARRAQRKVASAYHDFLQGDGPEPTALMEEARAEAASAKECWARYVRFTSANMPQEDSASLPLSTH